MNKEKLSGQKVGGGDYIVFHLGTYSINKQRKVQNVHFISNGIDFPNKHIFDKAENMYSS